jgi:hypothetical protein
MKKLWRKFYLWLLSTIKSKKMSVEQYYQELLLISRKHFDSILQELKSREAAGSIHYNDANTQVNPSFIRIINKEVDEIEFAIGTQRYLLELKITYAKGVRRFLIQTSEINYQATGGLIRNNLKDLTIAGNAADLTFMQDKLDTLTCNIGPMYLEELEKSWSMPSK